MTGIFITLTIKSGERIQVRACRIHPLHGVRQLPPALLLGGFRRLTNLRGEGVGRQSQGRVRLHGGEALGSTLYLALEPL
jgi:hypothetical protein